MRYGYPGYFRYPGYYGNSYYGVTSAYYPSAAAAISQNSEAVTPVSPESTTIADDYLQAARTSFLGGEYANAQRLANHAVVETPDNPKAHELLSLTMFAQGEFRGAAAAAHATAELGSVADWPTLYRYYNDKEKYIEHFRTLKKYVKDNPQAPEGRFLLGVHRVMMGHKEEAKTELGEYLKLIEQDPVAEKLYQEVGGQADTSLPPAAPTAEPSGESQAADAT